MKKIAIGNDHVAVEMKTAVKAYLEEQGYLVTDFGTNSGERCDYPVYAQKVCRAVLRGEAERGILICGTGIGMSIAANKIRGIRAAACSEPYSAQLSRRHNNTNILTFGSRVVGPELAKMIVDAWLNAEYEGGRHQARLDMISRLENGEEPD